jgi:lipopolysaccharide transport system ATP-binding protein
LQQSGSTILFVSHDANSVRNLCSRAIWLIDGRIRDEGNASKVVDAYLAHLFGRQVVTAAPMSSAKAKKVDQQIHPSLQMETSIPNIDRRLGDQRCQIIGVGLYDESMNRISSSINDKIVTLRLTIKNHSLDSNTALTVGYIFRNAKGQEIASTNSQIEGQAIGSVPQGDCVTICMKVTLPCLHPGSYAFTVTTGYIGQGEEIMLSDRIENAIAFDILSDKRIHVLMNLPTTFEVET